jgi:hypothetical protein
MQLMGLAMLVFIAIGTAVASADELNVQNLPKDPAGYRDAIQKLIAKVDALLEKQKGNKQMEAAVQDLLQTRDNIFRELPKVEKAPDGAKWSPEEGRNSVDKMLLDLKLRYDKLAAGA